MPKSSGNYRQNVVTHLLEYYSKRTVKLKKKRRKRCNADHYAPTINRLNTNFSN